MLRSWACRTGNSYLRCDAVLFIRKFSWNSHLAKAKPSKKQARNVLRFKKRADISKLQQDLENIDLKPLTEIVEESQQRYLESISIPDKEYYEKAGKYINGEKNSYWSLYDYIYAPPKVGDVVFFSDGVEYGSVLKGELAVILKVPTVVGAEYGYVVMNDKGVISQNGRNSFSFRLPKIFSRDYIEKAVIKKENELTGKMSYTIYGKEEVLEIYKGARKHIFKVLSDIHLKAIAYSNTSALPSLRIVNKVLTASNIKRITIFELLNIIERVSKNDEENLSDENPLFVYPGHELAYNAIKKETLFDFKSLGVNLGTPFDFERKEYSLDINPTPYKLFGVFLAIHTERNLWEITQFSINPVSRNLIVVQVKEDPTALVSNEDWKDNVDDFILHMNKYLNNENKEVKAMIVPPAYYDKMIGLLKDYAAGSFLDNDQLSFVFYVMRKVSLLADVPLLNRTCAFVLLDKLGEIKKDVNDETQLLISKNPILSNKYIHGLNKDDFDEVYYENLSENDLRNPDTGTFDDPLKDQRINFGNVPVFCIDSEDAHEIDDGISIEKNQDIWKITIHIADPGSYFKHNSHIANIALKKATTLYLPEIVLPMLPPVISKIAGLGIDGKLTRTISYSFHYDSTNKKILDKGEVVGGFVKNFPKGLTYDKVNKTLNDKSAKFNDELMSLLEVAKELKTQRVKNGGLIFQQNSVKVKKSKDHNNNDIITSDYSTNSYSESQELVSELMIKANCIAGSFLKSNNIPGLYRVLPNISGYKASKYLKENNSLTPKSEYICDKYEKLVKKYFETGKGIGFEDMAFIMAVSYNGQISSITSSHSFLGVKNYAPSTSPLRRYGDLISHWQIHNFLINRTPLISKEIMDAIAIYVEYQTFFFKKIQQNTEYYWRLVDIIRNFNGDSYDEQNMESLINVNYDSPKNSFTFTGIFLDRVNEKIYGMLKENQILAHLELNYIPHFEFTGDSINKINLKVRITSIQPVEGEVSVKPL